MKAESCFSTKVVSQGGEELGWEVVEVPGDDVVQSVGVQLGWASGVEVGAGELILEVSLLPPSKQE